MPTTFLLRRGTAIDWEIRNPRLHEGEIGYELGTWRYKIGDGLRSWNDLPYFEDKARTEAFIVSKIAELAGTVTGVTQQELLDHIDSPAPHLNYEDGADLTLLYENAKV